MFSNPPLSPRRRRLRWTISLLSAAAVLGGTGGWIVYRGHQPQVYRPDESNADITSSLDRALPAEAPQPRFADVTKAAGLAGFRSFIGDRTSQLPEDMGSGLAWGDFNNDGFEDLFLVSAGGPLNAAPSSLAPCELYENLGNGLFKKVDAFPELRIHGMGAAWGDYDGDGYLDLAVTGYNTLLLFHNEHGTGHFTRDTRLPERPGFWAGVAWGDYDNDRRLDLYVCGYVRYLENETDRARSSSQLGTSVPYTLNPASYEPEVNLMFHNVGTGGFAEVGGELGVQNPSGRSLSALWHDFDDDGWLDLYVANDIAGSVFYHNQGGRFEDASSAAWVTDYRSAMGLAAGDYNRDGDDDLFITHWVGQENALFDNLWADFNANPTRRPPLDLNRSTRGEASQAGSPGLETAQGRPGAAVSPTNSSSSTLAAGALSQTCETNRYPLRFMDVNAAKGLGQIALPYVGWGTEFVDFDADGWLDLVVANGSSLESEGPLPRRLKAQESFLFWNQKGEFFHNLAPSSKVLSQPHVSRGLAVCDYDNDGAMDVAMIQLGEGVQLLRNQMQTGQWLKLRLRSRSATGAATGFGDGAKVLAHLGGTILRRTVTSASYLSQSSRVVHFGLGAARSVDTLEVRWLGGATNLYTNLEANLTWELTEADPVPKRFQTRVAAQNTSGVPGQSAGSTAGGPSTNRVAGSKSDVVEFWARQRAAMSAMKIEGDIPKAIRLFRAALELNPRHEDSHYYLGNCLAMQGDLTSALDELATLTQINPQSHRGHAQWGTLRALSARSDSDLAQAEDSLQRAHDLNPEETGALLVLGEIALMRAKTELADTRLSRACRTNPKAAGGFFLRSYLAWKQGDLNAARELLDKTREALGKDWQPKGATSEGDVKQKWHVEKTPLSRFWEGWDGQSDPIRTFAPLSAFLSGSARSLSQPSAR